MNFCIAKEKSRRQIFLLSILVNFNHFDRLEARELLLFSNLEKDESFASLLTAQEEPSDKPGCTKEFREWRCHNLTFQIGKSFPVEKGLVFGVYRDFSTDMWKALERTFRR